MLSLLICRIKNAILFGKLDLPPPIIFTMKYDGFLIWFLNQDIRELPPYVSREEFLETISDRIQWLMILSSQIQNEPKPEGKVIPFRRP